ncbi:MAG: hypothetical protein ACI9WU_004686, partial [Myxococcota bacterium]
CDGVFDVERVEPDATKEVTLIGSGSYTCRAYELVGRTLVLNVAHNHTEDCQSCPQDCGECD